MAGFVAQYPHQPIAVAAFHLAHEAPLDAHQPPVRQIEGNGDSGYAVRREPFLRKPTMRPKSYSPHLELAVQAQDSLLQLRPENRELQVAEAQTQQLLVRQRFPRIANLARPAGAGRRISGLQHIV